MQKSHTELVSLSGLFAERAGRPAATMPESCPLDKKKPRAVGAGAGDQCRPRAAEGGDLRALWRKSFSTGLAVPARRQLFHATEAVPARPILLRCATSLASIVPARRAIFSFGIARRTTTTQERYDVDEARGQGRPRGRAFRVETNQADGATGKVGILRKRPSSFGFPIQNGSSSADHRMGG